MDYIDVTPYFEDLNLPVQQITHSIQESDRATSPVSREDIVLQNLLRDALKEHEAIIDTRFYSAQEAKDLEHYEFGAFGLADKDRQIEFNDDYALLEINANDTSYLVASIHFPSSQPVEYQLNHLFPLLDTMVDKVEQGDQFLIIGDINFLTVVGEDSSESLKKEVAYNIDKMVSQLEIYGAEHGVKFDLEFPEYTVSKARVKDDLTKNPQEQIKSGLTVRDTVLSIVGEYVGIDSFGFNDSVVTYSSAQQGVSSEVVPFSLFGEQPFDHVIISRVIGGREIKFVNVIESAGDKGFKENVYHSAPSDVLTEKWTRDVYETLAGVLRPEIRLEEIQTMSNEELKHFLNTNKIDLNGLSKSEKMDKVRGLAVEFTERVKSLSSTQMLSNYLQGGTIIDWDSIVSNIVASCVKKDGATSPFTNKLSNGELSQQVFGGFVLEQEAIELQYAYGAAFVREQFEAHQLQILEDLQQEQNGLVLLCENVKEHSDFTQIAKAPLFVGKSAFGLARLNRSGHAELTFH